MIFSGPVAGTESKITNQTQIQVKIPTFQPVQILLQAKILNFAFLFAPSHFCISFSSRDTFCFLFVFFCDSLVCSSLVCGSSLIFFCVS